MERTYETKSCWTWGMGAVVGMVRDKGDQVVHAARWTLGCGTRRLKLLFQPWIGQVYILLQGHGHVTYLLRLYLKGKQ
jgi:hypothetical protein